MTPAGKEAEGNARRRSQVLRRGRFTKDDAASRMSAQAVAGAFLQQAPDARREEICRIFGESYDPARWNDWRWQMRHRLIKPEHFEQLLQLTGAERRAPGAPP